MHPVKVILARHGETDWNAAARIQGKSDIPLNGRGRAQARELAAAVQRLGTVEVIYASPLARALETAEIIGEMYDETAGAVISRNLHLYALLCLILRYVHRESARSKSAAQKKACCCFKVINYRKTINNSCNSMLPVLYSA